MKKKSNYIIKYFASRQCISTSASSHGDICVMSTVWYSYGVSRAGGRRRSTCIYAEAEGAVMVPLSTAFFSVYTVHVLNVIVWTTSLNS